MSCNLKALSEKFTCVDIHIYVCSTANEVPD